MTRTFLVIFSILCISQVSAQGYFYTESTVQINGGASIEIKGNAIIHQAIDGDGFMVMNGDNPQTLGGNNAAMNNLRVTNNADVTLTDPLWVNDTLEMASGTLYIVDENIYLADNSVHTGNSMGYIETSGAGYIQRKLDNSPFTFHLGNEPEYFPLTISELGVADTFRIQGWDMLPDDGTATGLALNSHVALLSYSMVDLVPSGNDLSITMQWNDTKNAIDFVQAYAIGIWYNGSNYVELDNCPTNVNGMNPNLVSYNNISNVGTFGIGDSLYLSNIPSAFITPADTTVCEGSPVTFTAMPSGATSYLWNTTDATQSINVTTAGNYYVDITDSTGCIYRSDSIALSTLPLPSNPTITQTDSTLSISPIYSSYQWYLGGVLIAGATGPNYTVTGNGTYSVVVSGANGCTNTSTNYIYNTFGLEDEDVSVLIYNQQGQLYVHIDGDNIQQVYIYDALGKVVYHEPFITDVIPVQLSSGMYIIRAIGSKDDYIKKIVW